MSYNPDAMTVIVSGDLPPEMKEKLVNQLTADVLTAKEFSERESALAMQEQVEDDTEANREQAGLDGEGDGFAAPEETEVDSVEVTDTSDDTDANLDTETDGDDNADDTTDDDASDETTDTEEPTTDDDADPSDTESDEALVEEEDLEDLSEEDAEVKDDLDEPNAAFEHASSNGSKEIGRYLRLGVAKYKRRVRRERKNKELNLAQETLQMEAAQRQKLIRRLLYVKPTDSGFTSKLQTFISTINNPDDWVALIDSDDVNTSGGELTKRQITEALAKAGIQMFENVETLADTYNQVQKAITEPSSAQGNNDEF